MVDPLFQKTSALFDEGGASGLLLNNLSVHRGCNICFDSEEVPEYREPTDSAEAPLEGATVDLSSMEHILNAAHRQAAAPGTRITPSVRVVEDLLQGLVGGVAPTAAAAAAREALAADQSAGVAGVSLFAGMAFTSSKALCIPHVEVPDIRWVDWRALKRAGFKACVFDKDNTLTAPYERAVEPRVRDALQECIAVFGAENVAVLSNSAGLTQYDPTGAVADELEAALGIGFVRHSSKKPSGSCVALEERFQCSPTDMVMLGDRYLTDVVYGNRHGMFTVRCAPFTEAGESASIRAAKWIEEVAVRWWRKPEGSKKPERCPGKKPHANVPEGKDASHFVASPGVW